MLCSFPSLRGIKNSFLAAGVSLALPGTFLPAQQAGYTVRGTVLDSTTRQPIARALVQIGGDAALTDSTGGFELSNGPAQPATILVRRPGYITNQDNSSGFQPSQDQLSMFSVAAGADAPPAELFLRPESVLTGQVSLPSANPADGIQLTAYRKGVENGRPMWKEAGAAVTNSEGIFRIASLPPGSYLLYALPSTDLSYARNAKASSGYPPVYFPGVTDASAASVIRLATGEHKQADITLLRQTLYPVTIKVANAQPGSYVNLDIRDTGGRSMQTGASYDPQQQTAHTSLPPGRYLVDARAFDIGNGRSSLFGHSEFIVSAVPVTYVGVTVLPLRNLLVTIRKEFPVPANVTTGGSGPGVNLNLIAAYVAFNGGNYAGGLEPVPGSNGGDSYQVKDVPPGKYWVAADAWGSYVSSITSEGVDLTRDVLTVGAGGSSAPIEITLRNDPGSIDGTVRSSAGGEERRTWLYAIPLFPTNASLPPSTVLDGPGKFSINPLAPGSYRVVACDSPREIEFHTPEGLEAWDGKGQVVSVETGGTTHVQLDLTSIGEQSQ